MVKFSIINKSLFFFALNLGLFLELNAQSGYHYLQNPVLINQNTIGTWTDVDVSAYIPEGTTGVILHLVNDGTEGARFAVRKNGSSDAFQDVCIMSAGTNTYAFCGVDNSRMFEVYKQSANCKIFLTGYSDNKVVYFDNSHDVSISTTNQWVQINVSSFNVPVYATGLILQVTGNSAYNYAGVRSKGATDDRTSSGSIVYQYGNYTYLFCAINEERIFEGKIGAVGIKYRLVGYTTRPVKFLKKAEKINLSVTGQWTDINLGYILPKATTGIIFEINNTYNGAIAGGIRENGSTDTLSSVSKIRNWSFTQGACGVDVSKTIEAYKNISGIDFYIIGFTQNTDSTAPSDIPSISDGAGVDIDFSYSTIQLHSNWRKSTDAESGIGRYLYAIGTSPGSTDIINWTENGTDTFVIVTGLNLQIGVKYYFSVKAENSQCLVSNVTISDGIEIIADPSIPVHTGQVRDGLSPSSDEQNTYSRTILSAIWPKAADNESGIKKYQYAIGTSSGATNVVDWTDNGLDTLVTVTGLNLTVGATYFFSIKAINTQNMESPYLSSDGIKVIYDGTPPAKITEVRDGIGSDSEFAYLKTELRANWSPSADIESGIYKYIFAIGTKKGGNNIVDWTEMGADTSIIKPGLSLSADSVYYISVIAENTSGLRSEATSSNGIKIKKLKENELVANSGSSEDIQAAVNSIHAIGGGTFYLPEGIFRMESRVDLYSNISIIGAGMKKTVIHMSDAAFFNATSGGDSLIRISGVSLLGYTIINFRSVVDFRIDHCYFEPTRNSSYLLYINNIAGAPSTRGVIDHCNFYDTFTGTYAIHCGPKKWPASERSINVLGTSDAVFVEDCYFHRVDNHPVAGFNGANYVVRFCSSYRCGNFDGHGPVFENLLGDNTQQRGTRCYEYYNNYFFEPQESSLDERWSALGLRGGGGVVYNNTFVYHRYAVRLTMETGSVTPTGGTYPGIDQIHDMFIWDNKMVDMSQLILLYANNAAELIQENRDYFLRRPTLEFDGFVYNPYTYPHPLTTHSKIGDTETNVYRRSVSLCQGQSQFIGGKMQNSSGIYMDTLKTVSGIDSIIATTLKVYPVYSISVDTTVKPGDKYFAGGAQQTKSGIYRDTLISKTGCDSIIITNLKFDGQGINSITSDGLINVYPNPSNGSFTVSIDNMLGDISVKVISETGQVVHVQNFTEKGKIKVVTITESIKPGIYIIKVVTPFKVYTGKLIINE